MPAKTETRRILIKVDSSKSPAIEKMAKEMGLLNKNTKSLAGNMSFLTNAFTGFLGYLGVREITRMSDEMQNLSNRLKITGQAGETTAGTIEKISDLASRTNQAIGDVATVYNRLAISLTQANPKAEELIALSEVLIDTFRVAGATTGETANTMIQLSQAFASGELRGQELRSVMEQNGVLAKLLREEFGRDVYKKAEKGLIGVTDVMNLLVKNQKTILGQAKELAPTFEQTMTKAMNSVAVQIGKLNEEFKLSAKFATLMGVAVENLAVIVEVVAISAIPLLVAGIRSIGASLLALNINPVVLALSALVVLGTAIYTNWEKIKSLFDGINNSINDMVISIEEFKQSFGGYEKFDKQFGTSTAKAAEDYLNKLRDEAARARGDVNRPSNRGDYKEFNAIKSESNALKDLAEKLKVTGKAAKEAKIKEILGGINKEFLKSGDIEAYNKKLVNFELYKLNREFKEGKFDIFEYNKRLTELNLQQLNRQLKDGVINLSQYQKIVQNSKVSELTAQFEAGKITLIEYNKELVKLGDKFRPGSALIAGTSAYLDSIGTLSDNVAKGITSTFGHLEDNLVEFVKTGEFNFKKFTESVLDDLTRIIIRAAIIRPLAEGILGGAVGAGAGAAAPAAKGMAFDSGVRKFAKGGIVDSPTSFSFGGGRRGLMGEAGTEAIIPLQRAGNGDLGVAASVTPVTVNIFNQTGADVEQRESTGPNGEKSIDVLITQKVRDGLYTGKFDSAMKQSYGVSRRGS